MFEQILRKSLNVAATEELIDAYLASKEQKKAQSRSVYVLKDVRLFLNTVTRGMNMMQKSGINAKYGRDETEQEIILTIKIPKSSR